MEGSDTDRLSDARVELGEKGEREGGSRGQPLLLLHSQTRSSSSDSLGRWESYLLVGRG